MPSTIPQKQNEAKSLNLLAAQRLLYSRAKRIGTVKLFLAIATAALVIPLALGYFADFKPYMGLIGFVITIVNTFVITKSINKKVLQAAQIQEEFDVHVFGIPTNESLVGGNVTRDLRNSLSDQYGDQTDLKNWYPDTSTTSPEKAVLISQRANLVWGWRQRQFFLGWVKTITFLLLLIPMSYAFWQDISFRDYFLKLFLPILPLMVLGIETMLKHQKVLDLQKSKEKEIEKILKGSGLISKEKLRVIQDAIFRNRKENAMTPDWVYSLKKDSYEKQMKESTKEIIAGN